MNVGQFAIASLVTLLTAEVPSSAPILPAAEQPVSPPLSLIAPHTLKSTFFFSKHADGRRVTANAYTSVVTFDSIKCASTKGCHFGFDGMIQILCRNTDSNEFHYYAADIYLVSEINGVYGSVAPSQTSLDIDGAEPTYFPITPPYFFQSYQAVKNGTTNSGALQVEMVQTGGTDTPDCILGDWTATVPFYAP